MAGTKILAVDQHLILCNLRNGMYQLSQPIYPVRERIQRHIAGEPEQRMEATCRLTIGNMAYMADDYCSRFRVSYYEIIRVNTTLYMSISANVVYGVMHRMV